MDREGVHRMEPQGIKNKRFWDDPRCKEDQNGWVQPFTVWQGWEEFNRAVYYLQCVLNWHLAKRPFTDLVRVNNDLGAFRWAMRRTALCDKPKLP